MFLLRLIRVRSSKGYDFYHKILSIYQNILVVHQQHPETGLFLSLIRQAKNAED